MVCRFIHGEHSFSVVPIFFVTLAKNRGKRVNDTFETRVTKQINPCNTVDNVQILVPFLFSVVDILEEYLLTMQFEIRLKRFQFACRKTKLKVMILTNHNRRK